MPKKSKTDNQLVTSKEFNETKKEFIERFDKIEKNMATKDDIKAVRSEMATKNDIERLSIAIIKNTEDIKNIKETMATKDDVRQILSAIDDFTGKNKDHERKAITNTHRIKELEPKVDDHEKRISVLESQSPTRT